MPPSLDMDNLFFAFDSIIPLKGDQINKGDRFAKQSGGSFSNTSLFDILEREFCAPNSNAQGSMALHSGNFFDSTPILELEPAPIREPARFSTAPSCQQQPAMLGGLGDNRSLDNFFASATQACAPVMEPVSSSSTAYRLEAAVNSTTTHHLGSNSSTEVDCVTVRGAGRYDVICSRGREFHKHPGCIRYRELIKEYQEEYRSSTKRVDKAVVIEMLVDRVREVESMGETARFLKYNRKTDTFEEMDEKTVRDKVGHALRAN